MSQQPVTERANPRTRDLDLLEIEPLVALLASEQRDAAAAVERATPQIARAVETIVARVRAGSRLHYVGAGSSGRLAMLDAAECPPTFGVAPDLVQAHVAGGLEALARAVEGAEDDATAGRALALEKIAAGDVVIGISAGGGAPFVVAAVSSARAGGALTIALTSVAGSPLALAAEQAIVVETGAEPIAGSTRLKAGTAQKLVLNALSTAAMIRLGHVHDNVMVDVLATNRKLHVRAVRLVAVLAEVSEARAAELLDDARGSVKTAIVMSRRTVGAREARRLLEERGGFLRPLL